MTGGLVDEQPELVEHRQRVAELNDRRNAYMAWRRERLDEYRAALERHHAEVDRAIGAGEPPPERKPEPPLADADHHAHVAKFAADEAALANEETRLLASIRGRVTDQARRCTRDAVNEARQHVDDLERLCRVIRDAQQAVQAVEAAQNTLDAADPAVGRRHLEFPSPPTPSSLLDAVARGVDLLEIRLERQLGMRGSNLDAQQPTRNPEPMPGHPPAERTHSRPGYR